MISQKDIEKINSLKAQGLNASQISKTLGISRPTVAKYLNETESEEPTDGLPKETVDRDLTTSRSFDDLFEIDKCEKCNTQYPAPKFLHQWRCPYCKTGYSWEEPWFKP